MGIMKRGTLMTLPLELIDHIYADISFLAARPPSAAPLQKIPQPHGRMCLIPQHQRLLRFSRDGTLVLARECPFDMVRARQEPLGWFHRKQSPNRFRVAHSQAAQVPGVLPHLRSRSVEVSVLENRHRTVAWTLPWDVPFWLRSFTTCIRYVLYHPVPNSAYIEWARPRFGHIPCPSRRSLTSRSEAYPHTLRFLSCSHTSRPSAQYRSIWIPSAMYVPTCPAIPHSFLADGIDRRSPRPVEGIPLLSLERGYRALEYSPRTRHLSGT